MNRSTQGSLLGVFLFLLNTVRIVGLVFQKQNSANSVLIYNYLGVAFFLENRGLFVASGWMWVLGLILCSRRWAPLKTYVASEVILSAPSWLYVGMLLWTGPSFHTGSLDQQLMFLFFMLLFSVLPVGCAVYLIRKRKESSS